ncbi:recQ-mediated genome instability protein 1 [Quaeritorhiza haematococci]|nr:recQ-mediated genome instability protein 1 [Quaeritorhiza haematococci]
MLATMNRPSSSSTAEYLNSLSIRVQPEWLQECIAFIRANYAHHPSQLTDQAMNDFVLAQYLHGDLAMMSPPVLPADIGDPGKFMGDNRGGHGNGWWFGKKMVLQVVDIMEVGESAQSLLNIILDSKPKKKKRQEQEQQQPVPKFPRKMLRLTLSDGFTEVPAMEFRHIPGISLLDPLGMKICIDSAPLRLGVLLLEATNTRILGGDVSAFNEVEPLVRIENKLRHMLGIQHENPQPHADADLPPAYRAVPDPGRRGPRPEQQQQQQVEHQPPPKPQNRVFNIETGMMEEAAGLANHQHDGECDEFDQFDDFDDFGGIDLAALEALESGNVDALNGQQVAPGAVAHQGVRDFDDDVGVDALDVLDHSVLPDVDGLSGISDRKGKGVMRSAPAPPTGHSPSHVITPQARISPQTRNVPAPASVKSPNKKPRLSLPGDVDDGDDDVIVVGVVNRGVPQKGFMGASSKSTLRELVELDAIIRSRSRDLVSVKARISHFSKLKIDEITGFSVVVTLNDGSGVEKKAVMENAIISGFLGLTFAEFQDCKKTEEGRNRLRTAFVSFETTLNNLHCIFELDLEACIQDGSDPLVREIDISRLPKIVAWRDFEFGDSDVEVIE